MVKLEKEFSKNILVDKITQEPMSYTLTASEAVCQDLAERLGIEAVESFSAEVSIYRKPQLKAIYVEGRVRAKVIQACILSGEPVAEAIDDSFESYFVANNEIIEELELRDPAFLYEDVEMLQDEKIDIGELAAQYLSLFLDPYPKKSEMDITKIKKKGVSLKTEEEMAEELRQEQNPFKVLNTLKKD